MLTMKYMLSNCIVSQAMSLCHVPEIAVLFYKFLLTLLQNRSFSFATFANIYRTLVQILVFSPRLLVFSTGIYWVCFENDTGRKQSSYCSMSTQLLDSYYLIPGQSLSSKFF